MMVKGRGSASASSTNTPTPSSIMTSEPQHNSTSTTLYKILTPAEFTSLPTPPTLWIGTTFDTSSTPPGLHLSTSTQLSSTLNQFFSDEKFEEEGLWILAIPITERLKKKVKWESEETGCALMSFGGKGMRRGWMFGRKWQFADQ